MKRILITGGAGFVGSSLAFHLLREHPGTEILCLDNLHRKGSEIISQRLQRAGIRFIREDVRNLDKVDLPECDLIIDAAAEPSVMAGQGGKNVEYVVGTNLGGTLNALELARRWRSRLVFLSTSRVYPLEALRHIRLEERTSRLEISRKQDLPGISVEGISEDFPLAGARTLYGATKFASEIMVQEYAAQFGVGTLINRCGVLAGPWQMGRADQGIVALWVAAHHYGRRLSYIGYGGKQVRDILHVDDLGDLLIRQLATEDCWHGDVYNVGGGAKNSVSLRELTQLTVKAVGRSLAIEDVAESRPGDVPLYVTNSERVSKRFDWQPKRTIQEIVQATARWINENEDILKPIFAEQEAER